MKSSTNLIILTILLFGLTNCSSVYYNLSPDEESQFEQGRSVVEKEDASFYTSVSFEEQADEDFVFHLFVYNKGEEKILFDPSRIYYKSYDSNRMLISKNREYAIDPEIQLSNIEKDIEDRKESHDEATGLNIVFALFDTIVDLTDDDDNDAEEVFENAAIFTENQVNEEISYSNDIEYLKANKGFWKNEVIRKTDLAEDEGIDGYIYVPVNPDAKFIKLFVPLDDGVHSYKFMQHEK